MAYGFINTRTGEYPRFVGDVEQAPNEPWEVVEETAPPTLEAMQTLVELPPVKDEKGIYRQQWSVKTFTAAEWEARRLALVKARIEALGFTVEDLKLLLSEGA